ncbi:hypothetical protein [Streptomyces nigrescens]
MAQNFAGYRSDALPPLPNQFGLLLVEVAGSKRFRSLANVGSRIGIEFRDTRINR